MLKDYRQWLQDLLDQLGRGDIGVGNVELNPPRLLFTLHKGRSTYDASLPVAAFFDRPHVIGRLCDLVVRFNKDLGSGNYWKGPAQDHEVKRPVGSTT
jgi:hypothetical protein